MSIDRYIEQFRRMRVNSEPRARPSPHKPCMVLAVIEAYEREARRDNVVEYTEELRAAFERYRRTVDDPDRKSGPWYPFFHLRSEPFWSLRPRPGKKAPLAKMKRPETERNLLAHVRHAEIDPELHALLLDRRSRGRLREALVARWFPGHAAAIARIAEDRGDEDFDDDDIAAGPNYREGPPPDAAVHPSSAVRDRPAAPAVDAGDRFRQVVLAAYDYRCAASGWRMLLPGAPPQPAAAPLIDAVRLAPRAVADGDEARFGMALTPTYHRALECGLIAPGPDLRWRVSRVLHERVADHAPLLDLDGRDVIFTGDTVDRPAEQALRWRIERLRPRARLPLDAPHQRQTGR